MGVQNIVKEIKHCHEKWLQHVQRMDTNRIQKQAIEYQPKGRRNIGRPNGGGGGGCGGGGGGDDDEEEVGEDDEYDDNNNNMREYDEGWLESCSSWMNRTVTYTSVSLRLDSSQKN